MEKLSAKQYAEMWKLIVKKFKISTAMRTRDFSGKCEIPDHRKVIYFMLIQSYFPNALMHDLFPDETPIKYNNQEHLIISPQTV